MQHHLWLCNYITAKTWAMLFSRDTIDNKLKLMAAFFMTNLGLRHPCEQTKKLAVIIVLEASNVNVDPQSAYDYVVDLGKYVEQKRSSIQNVQTKPNFPERWQTL